MKFYKLDDIPIRGDDKVFKASPLRAFLPCFIFLVIVLALVLLRILGGSHLGLSMPPAFMLYGLMLVFGLFGLAMFGQFRATLKPTNWLLRCNSTGVIIKYRSFLNWRFSREDMQAVAIDYSEIAWVRRVKERRISPGFNGENQSQVMTYVDFCLVNADTSALETHLQAEQKLQSNGKLLALDYPVEVLPGGMVQLRWTGGGAGVSPTAHKAIEYLGRFMKIAEADSSTRNLTHQSNMKPGEEDAKIIALVKSGDKLGAIKLARQIYGSSLSEAVAFVDKLQSRG